MSRIRTMTAAALLAVGLTLGSATAAHAAPAPKCLGMYGQELLPILCKDPSKARPIGKGDKPPTRKQLISCAGGLLLAPFGPPAAAGALWCMYELVVPEDI